MPNVIGHSMLRKANIYFGAGNPITVNFPLRRAKKDITIGLMAGYFDPLHPMHLLLAAETIIKGYNDKVIFLPVDVSTRKPNASPFEQRYGSLEKILSSFSPWFLLSDQKRNRNNPDAVAAIRERYPAEFFYPSKVKFNWIASSAGQSGFEIFKLINSGHTIQEALSAVISPYISKYLYFHSQPSEIVDAFRKYPRMRTMVIPDKYRPIEFIHSTLIREGQLNWSLKRTEDQIDIIIEHH
jgi:hypothetical protein